MPNPSEAFDISHFLGRVEEEAQRIAASYWGPNERARATQDYERATRRALRAPALAERSVVLRKVGKRVVPQRLVPLAKRLVRGFDRCSRGVAELVSYRRTER